MSWHHCGYVLLNRQSILFQNFHETYFYFICNWLHLYFIKFWLLHLRYIVLIMMDNFCKLFLSADLIYNRSKCHNDPLFSKLSFFILCLVMKFKKTCLHNVNIKKVKESNKITPNYYYLCMKYKMGMRDHINVSNSHKRMIFSKHNADILWFPISQNITQYPYLRNQPNHMVHQSHTVFATYLLIKHQPTNLKTCFQLKNQLFSPLLSIY